jgi:hypothetical protein
MGRTGVWGVVLAMLLAVVLVSPFGPALRGIVGKLSEKDVMAKGQVWMDQ